MMAAYLANDANRIAVMNTVFTFMITIRESNTLLSQ